MNINGDVSVMNFETFSLSNLQTFKALLEVYLNNDFKSVVDIKNNLDTVIKKRSSNLNFQKPNSIIKEEKNRLCPYCAKVLLRVVVNPDGLKILGCPKCRYSEIREDKDGK